MSDLSLMLSLTLEDISQRIGHELGLGVDELEITKATGWEITQADHDGELLWINLEKVDR